MEAIFQEWSLPPWLTLSVILIAAVYVKGWVAIRKTRKAQVTVSRLSYFFLGLAVLWLAIASPLDGFADVALSAHMLQHLLLMSAVPPLVLLGWPTVPLLRGLPRIVQKVAIHPLLRVTSLRRFGFLLLSPIPAWMAMNVTFLTWHVPKAYNFALQHEHWHQFEHMCFLITSLVFWSPIIRPWPALNNRQSWGSLVYLVSADLINTALSAFLVFCEFPVYRFYLNQHNPLALSPLSDQILGGLIMWLGGSFAFLLPAALIVFSFLQSPSSSIVKRSSSISTEVVRFQETNNDRSLS